MTRSAGEVSHNVAKASKGRKPATARELHILSPRRLLAGHSPAGFQSARQLDKPRSARHSTAMLSKELVAASTVPLVLSVLTEGENYGYALIQRVRELSGGRIEWTEGMLYPVLHWMEKEKLIESDWREAETGRKRKYYRLRKEGRKTLQAERQQWMSVHETLSKLWNTQPSST